MDRDETEKALTYTAKKPNINALKDAYDRTRRELNSYFELCRDSYDNRRNYWTGKSRDLRKHGANAFPWEGASDLESHVIEERITRMVSLLMNALKRANVRAFPVESTDAPRSALVSSFLKWMLTSGYIPRFYREMELGANYLLERGLLVTYVGWHAEDRRYLESLSLEQIVQQAPQVAELIAFGERDEELAVMLMQSFEGLTEKRALQGIKDLRETGYAQLPTIRRQVDAPDVKTLAPDSDFYFPSFVTDPQRAPYCFWRTYYSPQEMKNKVITDNWDPAWVNYVIEHYRGVNVNSVERDQGQTGRRLLSGSETNYEAKELVEVLYGYQRLVDPDDGAEGIYLTIFHSEFTGKNRVPGYAKHELLNGCEDYPVEVTRLSEDSKRLYDGTTVPELLRGLQWQVKVERDSRIDRNSLATLPPMIHRVGNAPTDYGPGRKIPRSRPGDLEFAPVPPFNGGSIEIEQTLQDQADRLVGLDEENPISQMRRQFLVDKFLSHAAKVIQMAYRNFQRYGPDEIFFRVTGSPDAMTMTKGDPDENFNIMITFDVLNTDPESTQKKLQQLLTLTQMDRNGKFDIDALLSIAAYNTDPVLADSVLQPSQQAQQQMAEQITDDLTKIYSGIELDARPNGAQVALGIIQQYSQQPDVAERLQTDEAFMARMEKYAGQYTFQMQQMQNAEIGKIGTAPAQMGAMPTRQINAQ